MSIVHIDQEYGCQLAYTNNKLVLKKDEEELQSVFLFDCDAVVINNNSSITSSAVNAILENNIPSYFISNKGEFLGKIQTFDKKNIFLRKRQYILSEDKTWTFNLQRNIVLGKLRNMRTILMRYKRYHKECLIENNISHLTYIIENLENATIEEKVMGFEGVGSHIYFNAVSKIINPPFTFKTRSRRPPKDQVNAMLGYLYAMLAGSVERAINITGLDSFCGFLHADTYGRESLVYDLMEEFRPVICDSIAIFMCNTKMIDLNDFESKDGGIYLNKSGRKKVVEAFYKRVNTTIKYEGKDISYEKLFYKKALELANCITEISCQYKPFLVR